MARDGGDVPRAALRDGTAAGAWAAFLGGAPSTAEALLRGGDPLEASEAAGSILLPGETRRRRLLLAAIPVHLALSLAWACGIALVAPRRREVPFGAAAGLAIAALDLGVIGRRFPRIRALRPLPQVADHVAFGLVVGWVLSRRRAQSSRSGSRTARRQGPPSS
jgi:hypothetical protein